MYSQPNFFKDIILFTASQSKQSMSCLSAIQQHNLAAGLSVTHVRLDTPESRLAAASGGKVRITHVPTLLVEFIDGNVKTFEGAPAILEFLTGYKRSMSAPVQLDEPEKIDRQSSGEQSDDSGPISPSKKKKKKRKPKEKKATDVRSLAEKFKQERENTLKAMGTNNDLD